MQHGRDDAGGAIGRGGDHPATSGVLFVDRQGVQVDPVEYGQRIAQIGLRSIAQFGVQGRGAPADPQAAGQFAGRAQATGDAVLHGRPERAQAGVDGFVVAPDPFVGAHQVGDGQAVVGAAAQQFRAGGERMRQGGGVGDDPVFGGFVLVDHEAAADRVVVALSQGRAVGVEGGEAHAIGVIGQFLALVEDQVGPLVDADLVLVVQAKAPTAADAVEAVLDAIGIDPVRLLAFQAEQDRLVGAVAASGQGQRAEQFHPDPDAARQQAGITQPAFDEACGGAHRSHGMRGRRADADFEQVEQADGHAGLRVGGTILCPRRTGPKSMTGDPMIRAAGVRGQ